MEYYSRQIVLAEMGYKTQLRLKRAKACIVGLGGLGSPIATQLAAIGVGHLRLVDRDVVEMSNLHRQHLYSVDHLGWPKVEVAANKLGRLNPYIEFEPLPVSINQETAEDLVRDMDVVVDGLDRMNPRYAINRACVKLGVPYVFGAAITTFGNASTIIPEKTPCLECFYGNIPDEMLPSCGVVGVHPSILGIMASVEVSEAIRILVNQQPQLANKLLYCDIKNLKLYDVSISKAENCPVCGLQPGASHSTSKMETVEEVCGRGGKRVFVVAPEKQIEINMLNLYEFLRKNGFNIKVKGSLGVTFYKDQVTASILKSGIMIVEGIKNKETALYFFRSIIVEGLYTL